MMKVLCKITDLADKGVESGLYTQEDYDTILDNGIEMYTNANKELLKTYFNQLKLNTMAKKVVKPAGTVKKTVVAKKPIVKKEVAPKAEEAVESKVEKKVVAKKPVAKKTASAPTTTQPTTPPKPVAKKPTTKKVGKDEGNSYEHLSVGMKISHFRNGVGVIVGFKADNKTGVLMHPICEFENGKTGAVMWNMAKNNVVE